MFFFLNKSIKVGIICLQSIYFATRYFTRKLYHAPFYACIHNAVDLELSSTDIETLNNFDAFDLYELMLLKETVNKIKITDTIVVHL